MLDKLESPEWASRIWSHLALQTYRVFWSIRQRLGRHSAWLQAILCAAIALAIASAGWVWADEAAQYFSQSSRQETFSGFLIALGSSLVAATAIGASLILFAMQVNIERMPHGLFRQLSRDSRLMGAFGLSMLLAIFVATLSLVPPHNLAGPTLALAASSTMINLTLLLAAYRRALDLVNPLKQLALVRRDANRKLERSARWAARLKPLLNNTPGQPPAEQRLDIARLTFFRANPGWDNAARRAVAYATSYTRRFAETGDYEIVGAACLCLVMVNHDYLRAKGKTFVASNPFIENPLSRDSFITSTLEQLRQTAQIAVSRGDERLTAAVFRALAELTKLYCTIDYGDHARSKTHAGLASAYLASAVMQASKTMGPDVIMDGVGQIGAAARHLMRASGPDDAVSMINEIGKLAIYSTVRAELRPAGQEAVRQLSEITVEMLSTSSGQLRFATSELLDKIRSCATLALTQGKTGFASVAEFILEPYYSSTSFTSLRQQLTDLTNAARNLDADHESARQFVQNVAEWAEVIQQTQKELLIAAVGRKSTFAYQLIAWNLGVAELLMALSGAPVAKPRYEKKILRSAASLVGTLSWLGASRETVELLEAFNTTEQIFEVGANALKWSCTDIAMQVCEQLLTWSLTAGALPTGWAVLERGLAGMGAILLLHGEKAPTEEFLKKLSEGLARPGAPSQELREQAASGLRELADSAAGEFELSRLKQALDSTPRQARRDLLLRIAGMLDPTAN